MLFIKYDDIIYQLPYNSSLYNELKNINVSETIFVLPLNMFSKESVNELINISEYENKQLKPETYNLLLILSLEYLLLNYNIQYNNNMIF